jgi:hypothetical protein
VYQSLHRIYGCRHGLPGLRASGKGDYVVGGGAKSLSYLVEKLEEAIEEEEYEVAAELRDEIEYVVLAILADLACSRATVH